MHLEKDNLFSGGCNQCNPYKMRQTMPWKLLRGHIKTQSLDIRNAMRKDETLRISDSPPSVFTDSFERHDTHVERELATVPSHAQTATPNRGAAEMASHVLAVEQSR